MQSISLENETLRLEFNPENGALIGLLTRETGWSMVRRGVRQAPVLLFRRSRQP